MTLRANALNYKIVPMCKQSEKDKRVESQFTIIRTGLGRMTKTGAVY